ncbi:MAG: N-acetylmuramoyl-L-alanine amidase [Chloroflexi bacterium]|nr:N-acetylmuramoyl-L-alanine amidase [Chloroflexota bacterium]
MWSLGRWMLRTGLAALVVALFFVGWRPRQVAAWSRSWLATTENTEPEFLAELRAAPTWAPPSSVIGIVAGHSGAQSDPGAVCPDGTTEAQVNRAIALLVQERLRALGYDAVVLDEFDPRLQGFRGPALVSIHADACVRREDLTGFKVAVSAALQRNEDLAALTQANRLKACLVEAYRQTTGLAYHPYTVTRDMTEYHAFAEIAPSTPAVIIEVGFLGQDYDLLVQQPERVAQGIVDGLLCFLEGN